nr:B12-independent methionine synthase 2 isoform 1 [Karenia mikimotoi]
MPLQTTVIGSFPKPDYVKVLDWFQVGTGGDSDKATEAYTKMLEMQTDAEKEEMERDLMRATKEIIGVQQECGIDVVTDGEVRRENYIHYLCRFIDGIDYKNLTEKSCRNGAYTTSLPTVRGKVSWRGPLDVVAEWKKAQEVSDIPVKYTLPGPMTIIGTLHNAHYEEEKELAADLAKVINLHVVALARGGCKFIQVDEPVLAREPKKALDYGIGLLDKCFEGVGKECTKAVHMSCGYPEYLDQVGYKKADPSAYFALAEAIDRTCIDALSIEDAHRHNDLSLLEKFKQTTIIFGAVTIASSKVETVEEIKDRLTDALTHIDAERLVVAPDCGLALLPPPILKLKLSNMCKAAKECGCKKPRTD